MRIHSVLALVALAHTATDALTAQQPDSLPAARASFMGRVVSSVDSSGVRAADMRLIFVDSSKVTRGRRGEESLELFTDSSRSRIGITDSLGSFAIRRLEPGQYMLQIRRIGYQPIEGVLNIDTTEVLSDFIMLQTSKTLATITVTERAGDRVKERLDRVGFLDRKRFRSSGIFVDRAEILKRKPHTVRDILARYGIYDGHFLVDRMPSDFETIRDYPAELVIGIEIHRRVRPTEFNMTRAAPSIMTRAGNMDAMKPLVVIWTYIP